MARFDMERGVVFEIAMVLAVCAGVLGAVLVIATGLGPLTILVVLGALYALAFAVVVVTSS